MPTEVKNLENKMRMEESSIQSVDASEDLEAKQHQSNTQEQDDSAETGVDGTLGLALTPEHDDDNDLSNEKDNQDDYSNEHSSGPSFKPPSFEPPRPAPNQQKKLTPKLLAPEEQLVYLRALQIQRQMKQQYPAWTNSNRLIRYDHDPRLARYSRTLQPQQQLNMAKAAHNAMYMNPEEIKNLLMINASLNPMFSQQIAEQAAIINQQNLDDLLNIQLADEAQDEMIEEQNQQQGMEQHDYLDDALIGLAGYEFLQDRDEKDSFELDNDDLKTIAPPMPKPGNNAGDDEKDDENVSIFSQAVAAVDGDDKGLFLASAAGVITEEFNSIKGAADSLENDLEDSFTKSFSPMGKV